MHMFIVCARGNEFVMMLSPSTRTPSKRVVAVVARRRRTGADVVEMGVSHMIGRSFLCICGCGSAHGVLNRMLGVCTAVARYGTVRLAHITCAHAVQVLDLLSYQPSGSGFLMVYACIMIAKRRVRRRNLPCAAYGRMRRGRLRSAAACWPLSRPVCVLGTHILPLWACYTCAKRCCVDTTRMHRNYRAFCC